MFSSRVSLLVFSCRVPFNCSLDACIEKIILSTSTEVSDIHMASLAILTNVGNLPFRLS